MLIGIDWGGTKIEGVAMEPDGAELLRIREDTPKGDYRGCIRMIVDIVERLERQTGRKGSIGVGIPGSLDPTNGLGKGCNSTWLLGQPVEIDVRTALGREIRMENDANCLASSEAIDGAGAGHGVVFAVILGTGVGAGIAIAGKAYPGPNNSAGEWGHHPLPMPHVSELPGTPCYCGKMGCLETWVSGTGFRNDYRRHTQEDVHGSEIMRRMRAGDRLSRLVYERYIDRLARGLSLVVNIMDPDIFVMGGGMSNIDELYQDLGPRIAHYTFSTVFRTPIVKAKHGDSSGVRGAAWLWREEA